MSKEQQIGWGSTVYVLTLYKYEPGGKTYFLDPVDGVEREYNPNPKHYYHYIKRVVENLEHETD